jgi:hypothetical protein
MIFHVKVEVDVWILENMLCTYFIKRRVDDPQKHSIQTKKIDLHVKCLGRKKKQKDERGEQKDKGGEG